MKIRVIDRIVLFVLATVSLFFGACAVTQLFGIDLMQLLGLSEILGKVSEMALRIVLAAVLVLVSLYLYSVSLRKKRKPAPFIQMDSGSKGSIRMAMTSISSLVEQTCRKLPGISNLKVSVVNHEDSVSIDLTFQVEMERSIPDLSAQIQQIVGEVVERNCGVAVRNVGVTIVGFSPVKSAQTALPPAKQSKQREKRRGWRQKDQKDAQRPDPEPETIPVSEEEPSVIALAPETAAEEPVPEESEVPADEAAVDELFEVKTVGEETSAEEAVEEETAAEEVTTAEPESDADEPVWSAVELDEIEQSGEDDDAEAPDAFEERE